MTREEAIYELQEDKRLYETEVCHAGDGSPDGRLLEALNMAIEALQAELAKHGEWIDVENEPYCECSVCKAYIDNLDDGYAFCPRCGADMRGDTECNI